jgi:hypothetical protein
VWRRIGSPNWVVWKKARLSYAQAMLPILRIIPVGGVFLAIAILLLALNAPGDRHAHFASSPMPPGGALIPLKEHPEWRQLLIRAALRRADELNRLRELPDTPVITAPAVPAQPKPDEPPAAALAGVQANPVDQDDVTGTVQSPNAALPVDIGETSSTELPVIPQEERPPVIVMPVREAPDDSATPQPVQPKPQSRNVAPDPAKQASREIAPAAAKPASSSEPRAKQASLEPARVEPKRAIRHAAHERGRARREARKKPSPRRTRRVTAQAQQAPFNLFQPFFGYTGSLPPATLRSAPEP